MTRKLEEDDKARVKSGQVELLHGYRGIIPIPSLGLMDNNLTVSETGFKAEEVNIFVNENSSEKNLQFIPKRYKYLSIGKKKENISKTQI